MHKRKIIPDVISTSLCYIIQALSEDVKFYYVVNEKLVIVICYDSIIVLLFLLDVNLPDVCCNQ